MNTSTAQPIRIVEAPATEPDDRQRVLLMSKRQALIIELGSIEDYLGLDRSIVPKRKRPEELQRKFERAMTSSQ